MTTVNAHRDEKKPNPGSDQAINAGCLCPIMDNEYGRGYMGQPGIFVYREDCPMHTVEFKAVKELDNMLDTPEAVGVPESGTDALEREWKVDKVLDIDALKLTDAERKPYDPPLGRTWSSYDEIQALLRAQLAKALYGIHDAIDTLGLRIEAEYGHHASGVIFAWLQRLRDDLTEAGLTRPARPPASQ